MSRISVFGLHSDRKAVLETLHKRGLVEVCQPEPQDFSFKETAQSIVQFDKYMQSAASALAVLDEYAPDKSRSQAN